MEQYSNSIEEHMQNGAEKPRAIHYTRVRANATRRQYKHEMLLTFITNVNRPPSHKRTNRTAPKRRASMLSTFLSLFV